MPLGSRNARAPKLKQPKQKRTEKEGLKAMIKIAAKTAAKVRK